MRRERLQREMKEISRKEAHRIREEDDRLQREAGRVREEEYKLQREAHRIREEEDRLQREADRVREGEHKLQREAGRLREEAYELERKRKKEQECLDEISQMHKNVCIVQQASTFQQPKKKYDLVQHNATFDPWRHGYVMKKGCLWYKRPDGVDVRAYAGANELTDEGELVPLCQLF